MWPQPPVALSTIWMMASFPANSLTSQNSGARVSLPPGLSFGPVALRTALPSISRFMQVFSGSLPPPMRKLMNLRSILNSGDVSVPVVPSPPWNELTNPFPRKPSTAIWFGRVPRAGPGPKASPVTLHAPQSLPSKSAIIRSPSATRPNAREQNDERRIMRWRANPFIERLRIAARAMVPSFA